MAIAIKSRMRTTFVAVLAPATMIVWVQVPATCACQEHASTDVSWIVAVTCFSDLYSNLSNYVFYYYKLNGTKTKRRFSRPHETRVLSVSLIRSNWMGSNLQRGERSGAGPFVRYLWQDDRTTIRITLRKRDCLKLAQRERGKPGCIQRPDRAKDDSQRALRFLGRVIVDADIAAWERAEN